MGPADWAAFNALPNVRKAESELLEAYVRGSTRHMLVKYSDPAGQESATIACQNTHMALRVGVPLASVLSCLGESQRLTIEHVVHTCAGDATRIVRLTSAINRLALLEMDIMKNYDDKLERPAIFIERQAPSGDSDWASAPLVQEPDAMRQQQ